MPKEAEINWSTLSHLLADTLVTLCQDHASMARYLPKFTLCT